MVLLNFIYPTSNTAMAGETIEVESGNFALGVGYDIVKFWGHDT